MTKRAWGRGYREGICVNFNILQEQYDALSAVATRLDVSISTLIREAALYAIDRDDLRDFAEDVVFE